ncbi:hypothetical protein PALB_9570 [Pseudoalteromonas luteoviolacea B = ATCC 29581]|nr:hypothetical protein PALB_9570 [Pseudoalteromonas luteoviolacea B = ATCC 29581]
MNALETKVPPVFVVLISAAMMWGVAQVTPLLPDATWRVSISVLLFLLGFAVALSGVVVFRLAHTTVNPTCPEKASNLVTQGVFQLTRNPMYLGMLLALASWAVYLLAPVSVFGIVLYVWYMNRFQIEPEERAMKKLFGEEYQDYCSSVRRWI